MHSQPPSLEKLRIYADAAGQFAWSFQVSPPADLTLGADILRSIHVPETAEKVGLVFR
jgi:hypothetical protein